VEYFLEEMEDQAEKRRITNQYQQALNLIAVKVQSQLLGRR
jgi:hypothetical protein